MELKASVNDEILSGATAKLAAVLAKHYNMSETFMLKVLQTNWHDFVEISWANCAVRACGGAGQARSVCVRLPRPGNPPHLFHEHGARSPGL